jgi:hypothetical protein
MQSEQIDKIIPALLKAQSEMGAVKKSAVNPFFKSRYADLYSVQQAVEEPLAKNGLVIVQGCGLGVNGNFVYTTLFHESGQWIKSEVPLILAKQDPQGVGSAVTYFRRYGIVSMLNLEQEDDDGNAASKPYVEKSGIDKLTSTQLNQLVDFKEAGVLQVKAVKPWHICAPDWLKKCGKSKLDELTEAQADKLIQECEKKYKLKTEE